MDGFYQSSLFSRYAILDFVYLETSPGLDLFIFCIKLVHRMASIFGKTIRADIKLIGFTVCILDLVPKSKNFIVIFVVVGVVVVTVVVVRNL